MNIEYVIKLHPEIVILEFGMNDNISDAPVKLYF